MNDKSLGEIAAKGFGYSDWNALSGSMRADFQRAAEAVQNEVLHRIMDQEKEERQERLRERWS